MIFTHYHTHTRFWKGWKLWIKLICHLLCSLTWLALYLFFNNSTNNHKETDTASYFFVTRDFLFKNTRHHNSSDCSRLAYKPPPELEFNFYELLVRYVAAMSQLIFIYLPKFKHVPPFFILVSLPHQPQQRRTFTSQEVVQPPEDQEQVLWDWETKHTDTWKPCPQDNSRQPLRILIQPILKGKRFFHSLSRAGPYVTCFAQCKLNTC